MTSTVLLTVDCLRSDHLGCYGYDRPTSPNIDAFADSATRFEYAYANCPGTRWAFQSLHTGVATARFENLGIPQSYAPLAQRLRDAGYETGGFANNGWVSRDFNFDRGFNTYFSVRETSGSDSLFVRTGKRINRLVNSELLTEYVLRPTREALRNFETNEDGYYAESHTDEQTVDRTVEFIQQNRSGGQDYFLWLHFMDAHTPYTHWPDHRRELNGTTDGHTVHPGDEGLVEAGSKPDQIVLDTYDASIREVDRQIGRVLEAVDEDTAVIITGDHGEEFGTYGSFHEASLYSSMTNVPIIADIPGVAAGVREGPVSHFDISATILSLADCDVPDYWDGRSLGDTEPNTENAIFFTLGSDRVAIRTDSWKYLRQNGQEELYRIEHGAVESDAEDVSDRYQQKRQTLRDRCDRFVNRDRLDTDGIDAVSDNMSASVEQNLEDLGYLR